MIFISHCSDDKNLMDKFSLCMENIINHKKCKLFNSHTLKYGATAGDGRSEVILKALKKSDIMLAIITESYLRSIICLSELSSFWYEEKKVIPIIFCKNAKEVINRLFGKDIIYIDASDIKKSDFDYINYAKNLEKVLINNSIPLSVSSNKLHEILVGAITNVYPAKSKRPYIGSEDIYSNIIQYCNEFGIRKLKNTNLKLEYIQKKLSDKKQIFILSTTASLFIQGLSASFIPAALLKGIDITVLIPNKWSDFCGDVATIESPTDIENNWNRLSTEFDNVMFNLKECVKKSHRENHNKDIGKIYVGCAYTLLRQTITLGIDGNGNAWGWASMTIPPKKTIDGTPSFEFDGSINDKSISQVFYEHISSIIDIAKRRKHYFEITENTHKITGFFDEKKVVCEYWKKRYDIAKFNMGIYHDRKKELIEVAAQHPLKDDGTVGEEFALRLDTAVSIYKKLSDNGIDTYIYVPGNRHKYNGIEDKLSLSTAGKNYLIGKSIPENKIFADDINKKYKGEKGVYNSADECYAATKLFLDNKFAELHCVCSANQMIRKKLFYIAFGVLPIFHPVYCKNMFHDEKNELFVSIPKTIFNDHTWQDDKSEFAVNSRKERMP